MSAQFVLTSSETSLNASQSQKSGVGFALSMSMKIFLKWLFTATLLLIGFGARAQLSCRDIFSEKPGALLKRQAPLEILEKPVPLGLFLEIYAISYPYGKSKGELYHFRARNEYVQQAKNAEGSNFKKLSNEYNTKTAKMFEALGFEPTQHPDLGTYWSKVPSPQLFTTLKNQWNEHFGYDPLRKIYINFAITGPDTQYQMLRLWLNNFTIGFANPYSGYDEFYIATGSVKSDSRPTTDLAMDKLTGRTDDNITLYYHDLGQMTNALHLPEAPLARTHKISEFYAEAYQFIKRNNKLIPEIQGHEAQEIRQAMTDYKPDHGESKLDPNKQGVDALSLFSVYLHHSQRGLHSITHILSWLITQNKGMNPDTWTMANRTSTEQNEFYVHLAGLGSRPTSTPMPPFLTPMLVLNWKAAQTGVPVNLQTAYNAITNVDMQRARKLVQTIHDPELTNIYLKYQQLGAFQQVSPQELNQWAQQTRDRYEAMHP